MLTPVIIYYSKPDCPYCEKLEALLHARGAKAIKYVVDVDFTREQLHAMVPHVAKLTFPQLFYGAEHVGGYTESAAFFENMDTEKMQLCAAE